METSFPDWFDILRKNILLNVLIITVSIIVIAGCEPNKEYSVDPVPIYSENLAIDSVYTRVKVISTGSSDSLFCGKKDIFDSYSIMKFDTVPESFDSLFLRFVSDTCTCELTLYRLKKEWDEDSVHLWDDIGSLIDTLSPIISAEMHPMPVDSPASDTNSLVYLGDPFSIDESTIDAIRNYGLAVHSDRFYSFVSERTRLKVITEDTLMDPAVGCSEDAYIVKNPFQDSVFSDSLLVGRGLSIGVNIFIPRDSLPPKLNKIAKADLCFGEVDSVPFSIVTEALNNDVTYRMTSFFENDSLKFDLATFFKSVPDDSVFQIKIKASQVLNGIGVKCIGDVNDVKIKFVWVEFP